MLTVMLLGAIAVYGQDQTPAAGNAPAQSLQSQQQPAAPPQIARTNLVELFNGPTVTEVYCAGFISKGTARASGTVVQGYEAPEQVHYSEGGYIYLQGNDLQEGKEYQLLRHTFDPNK